MRRSPVLSRARRGGCAVAFLFFAAVLALCGCAAQPFGAGPTATPTVDAAAVQRRLDTLARQAVADFSTQVQTTYDAGQRAAEEQVTVAWNAQITGADVPKEQERDKSICFRVQQAIWTSGAFPLRQLTVIVLGPVSTGYGEQITEAHAAARLTASTAASLSWATLTPDTAWGRYDEAYLRSDYDPPVV